VRFAAGEKEDGWSFFEAGEKRFRPESPDIWRGDDEGAEGIVFLIELFQPRIERAEEVRRDSHVVICGWRVDGNDRHDISIVSHAF
jgi:hypothetical protein